MNGRYTVTVEQNEQEIFVGLLDENVLIEYKHLDEDPVLQTIRMAIVSEPAGNSDTFWVDMKADRKGYLEAKGMKCGTLLPLQVIKLGAGQKGHLVTQEYTLQGHLLVLTPFDKRISISSKIQDPTVRERLKLWGERLPGQTEVGYILRTQASACKQDELQQEAEFLLERYHNILDRSKTASYGTVLFRAPNDLEQIIQRISPDAIRSVVFETRELYQKYHPDLVRGFPWLLDRIRIFEEPRWSIRDFYKISSQLVQAVQKKVLLRDGGSLVIEHTEAMTVIDVNSGGFSAQNREDGLYQTNCKAAREIARQIRLRNISGIIIVDFINMALKGHQDALLNLLKQLTRQDPVKTVVHGYTRLGLIEISRQRKDAPLYDHLDSRNIRSED